MKFSEVNKLTTVNRFVLHTLQRNITHLAVKTRKINKKTWCFEKGDWKKAGVPNLSFPQLGVQHTKIWAQYRL